MENNKMFFCEQYWLRSYGYFKYTKYYVNKYYVNTLCYSGSENLSLWRSKIDYK